MEWRNEDVFKFLEEYQIQSCIWDPMNVYHKNRIAVADAWEKIQQKLEFDCTIGDLKKKKDSLMASFRMLLRKKKQSLKSGSNSNEIFQPNWFAYKFMESFLAPVYHCDSILITEEDTTQDVSTDPLIHNDDEDDYDDDIQMTIEKIDNDKLVSEPTNGAHFKISTEKKNMEDSIVTTSKKIKGTIDTVSEKRFDRHKYEEDECDLYGKLLAMKLRKFNDLDREVLMNQIDNMLFQRRMASLSTVPITMPSISSTSKSQNLQSPPESLKRLSPVEFVTCYLEENGDMAESKVRKLDSGNFFK